MYTDKKKKQKVSRTFKKDTEMAMQQMQIGNRMNTFVRKAKGFTNNRSCQLKAWIGTRTLGLSGSSGIQSSGSTAGHGNENTNTQDVREKGFQIFNPKTKYNKLLIHAHILFENPHDLPTGQYNNIGYGQNGLFSESYEYKTIGHPMDNEEKVVSVIEDIQNNYSADNYNIMSHNCQDFVHEVYEKHNDSSDQG